MPSRPYPWTLGYSLKSHSSVYLDPSSVYSHPSSSQYLRRCTCADCYNAKYGNLNFYSAADQVQESALCSSCSDLDISVLLQPFERIRNSRRVCKTWELGEILGRYCPLCHLLRAAVKSSKSLVPSRDGTVRACVEPIAKYHDTGGGRVLDQFLEFALPALERICGVLPHLRSYLQETKKIGFYSANIIVRNQLRLELVDAISGSSELLSKSIQVRATQFERQVHGE